MLTGNPYSMPPEEKTIAMLEVLKGQLDYACERNAGLHNYVRHWPVDFRLARSIADLPYLPVGLLKAQPPLSLVEAKEIR
ncbi:MAG: hypothetical protein WAN11_16110, partial [Syntrophobacteraceae bacterium]